MKLKLGKLQFTPDHRDLKFAAYRTVALPPAPRIVEHKIDGEWGLLSPEMLRAEGKSPEGFDLEQLTRDLRAVQSS